jgi:hypothetical protein
MVNFGLELLIFSFTLLGLIYIAFLELYPFDTILTDNDKIQDHDSKNSLAICMLIILF